MPLFYFKCATCGALVRRLLSVEAAADPRDCATCGGAMQRDMRGATTQTMEVLDDGIRPVRLERYAEAERIYKEREWAHDQKYKDQTPEEE